MEEFYDIPVITIDMGNLVLCDYCNKDYTNSDAVGGLIFGSNAICPECEAEARASIKKYKEEFYITKEANGMSFRDLVLSVR